MSMFRVLCGALIEVDDIEGSDDIGCSYSLALVNHIFKIFSMNLTQIILDAACRNHSRYNYVQCSCHFSSSIISI